MPQNRNPWRHGNIEVTCPTITLVSPLQGGTWPMHAAYPKWDIMLTESDAVAQKTLMRRKRAAQRGERGLKAGRQKKTGLGGAPDRGEVNKTNQLLVASIFVSAIIHILRL